MCTIMNGPYVNVNNYIALEIVKSDNLLLILFAI